MEKRLNVVGFDDPGKTIGKFDSVGFESGFGKPLKTSLKCPECGSSNISQIIEEIVIRGGKTNYCTDCMIAFTPSISNVDQKAPIIKLPVRGEDGFVFEFSCPSDTCSNTWTQKSFGPCSKILGMCSNCGDDTYYNVIDEDGNASAMEALAYE